MYMCLRDIEFTYVYDFSIECWNCSDSVIYFFFHFIIGCEFFFMMMIYCLLILTAELKLQSLK